MKTGIYIFAVLFVLLIMGAISHSSTNLAIGVVGALLGLRLMTVGQSLIYWILFVDAIGLSIPISVTRSVDASILLQLTFVLGEIASGSLRHNSRTPMKRSDYCMIAFVILMFSTAYIRGFGIYSLGSSRIGGMDYLEKGLRYIFIITAAILVRARPLDAKRCFKIVFIGVLIKSIATFAAGYSASIYSSISNVVDINLRSDDLGSTSVTRIAILGPLAISLIPFVISQKRFAMRVVLMCVVIALAGASGFRSQLLTAAFLMISAELYCYKFDMIKFLKGLAVIALLYALIWTNIQNMQFRIQRGLCGLPGMRSRVSSDVKMSVDNSSTWRLELYKECLKHIPEHLLIGRGLVYDINYILRYLQASNYEMMRSEIFYENHSYHMAILDLMIDYGGLATVLLAAALIASFRNANKYLYNMDIYEKYASIYLVVSLISLFTIWSNYHTRWEGIFVAYIVCNSLNGKSENRSRCAKVERMQIDDSNMQIENNPT